MGAGVFAGADCNSVDLIVAVATSLRRRLNRCRASASCGAGLFNQSRIAIRSDMSGGLALPIDGLGAEDVGANHLEELTTRIRNAVASPFADTGLPYPTEGCHGGGTAEGINDPGIRVLVHGAMIGLPNIVVNRQTFSAAS